MCVCTIYEINETPDGQLYLVMAHYEGETLKERIARGPLEVSDAINIATQVGQGLAEAHNAGIVHRDIKPANLLVIKTGVAKILDFGLAKLAGAEGMTQTGTTLGTVAYMSPEQLRGEEVDHRTDIWSLGVVLFEMVAGQRPFKGERLEAVSVNILQSQPTSLAGSRTGVPADLERLVSRALVKPVADRYQTVADLHGDLQKLQSSPTVVTATQPEVPSIAVLPFVNMSADPEQEYFCDGMAEEIINALTALEGLHVASRTSAFQAKAKDFEMAEIGSRLKVKTVLEGSVRKAGNRLRVTAQLINVSDGYHLWSERYDEITQSVVEKLKVKLLGAADTPLVKRPTDNLEAYHLVLKGRYHALRVTRQALEKSLRCFTQALTLEPSYAQAHAGIAITQTIRSIVSFGPPRQLMPAAKDASLKALAIDDTVADAHFALAVVLRFYDWDWVEAEREHRRALDLNPGDTFARVEYALALAQAGRSDEALTEARAAVETDPLSVINRHLLAFVLWLTRRFDLAMVEARAGIELEPAFHFLYWDLGWALIALGRHDEAVESFRHATTLAPDDPEFQGALGWALGFVGHRDEARAILENLERRRSKEYVGGSLLAWVCLGLGDHDQAISWLQHAAEERDGMMTFLNTLFVFDPLRSDPRFEALLKRMNFPQASA